MMSKPTAQFPSPGSTSSSLLEAVRAWDGEAWSRLVDLYGPVVYRRGLLAHFDDQTAKDVVQEVFTAVARSIGGFERQSQKGSFRAWLRTITDNKIRDVIRRRVSEPQGTGGTVAQTLLVEMSRPTTGDTSGFSDDDEKTLLIRQALARIKGEFKDHNWQAFWRMAVDGQTSEEVATELGLKAAAVRQAKVRILRRLKHELGELFD
ncbi:MAG: sigma-70 family RNA polymerase sigma factor [Planctomycetes bacterium]|nr:sigma-70 family RNA polymerase sigma factor [Planctomycetota bacterium]MBL7043246.1 sigma-70 family RNA polymerase sigma factor [Pirellulaceae bacterium]